MSFISVESVVKNKIKSGNEQFISDFILRYKELAIILIVKDFKMVSDNQRKDILTAVGTLFKKQKMGTVLLTSSSSNDLKCILSNFHNVGKVDSKALSSIMATNIGFILIKDGIVVGRWMQTSLSLQEYPKTIEDLRMNSYLGHIFISINFLFLSIVLAVYIFKDKIFILREPKSNNRVGRI